MTDSIEIERTKKLVTIGKTITITSVLAEVAIIILYRVDVWESQKKMLLSLALIPWIKFIYALIYPEIAVWDEYNRNKSEHSIRLTKRWKETHLQFCEGWYCMVQALVMLYLMINLFVVAQTYKGFKTILLIWGAAFLIMLLIGYIRINGENKVRQMIYFGVIMTAVLGFTVNAGCYYFSSPATHEECTFVSKSVSHSTKGGNYYYVTVKLQDGTEYESQVGKSLYQEAEEVELIACHRNGPFGIEYLRVHGS